MATLESVEVVSGIREAEATVGQRALTAAQFNQEVELGARRIPNEEQMTPAQWALQLRVPDRPVREQMPTQFPRCGCLPGLERGPPGGIATKQPPGEVEAVGVDEQCLASPSRVAGSSGEPAAHDDSGSSRRLTELMQ
jgi:hypothetical protein